MRVPNTQKAIIRLHQVLQQVWIQKEVRMDLPQSSEQMVKAAKEERRFSTENPQKSNSLLFYLLWYVQLSENLRKVHEDNEAILSGHHQELKNEVYVQADSY